MAASAVSGTCQGVALWLSDRKKLQSQPTSGYHFDILEMI
jgi:hypothetical protein